jgi:hypothetical protein
MPCLISEAANSITGFARYFGFFAAKPRLGRERAERASGYDRFCSVVIGGGRHGATAAGPARHRILLLF